MIRKIDTNWNICDAFVWRGDYLHPIRDFNTFDINMLLNIDEQKEALLKNTLAFLENKGGFNALLYGPRGCGKSTLVRAVFTKYLQTELKIVQIATQDIGIIPIFVDAMRSKPYKFIIFCDDLSFESDDKLYKDLKVILDGSLEKIPSNVLLYATSNRKHLLREPQSDNANAMMINDEIHFGDSIEERISLSDRFPLNIAFYKPNTQEYLQIIASYFNEELDDELKKQALLYATQKGAKSGRVAYDFYRANKIGLIK